MEEKLFSFSGEDLTVGPEIIHRSGDIYWEWRGQKYTNLPDLVWEVLKKVYPRDKKALQAAMKVYPERFECSCCGECCRHISELLPEFDLGGGVCCHLGEDNLCDIYETRPLICRVEDFWGRCLGGKIPKEDWYSLNYLGCYDLQNKYHPLKDPKNNI